MVARTVVAARGVGKEVSSGGAPLTILGGVSMEVAAGESLAIVGRSGSGKTTLLSLLAGLDVPSAGEIELDGTRIDGLDEDARAGLRAGRVGFVFQSFQLLSGFTALENVMLPAELAGLADAQERARAALDRVGLGKRLDHYPHQLSGGEQQRVALARAFCGEPAILFADEPTGNLDTTTGTQIVELLFEMNAARGTTLVLVTHDAQLAARCGRTITLRDGRLDG
ncbi:MAG: ABC transporter ATP-binding protein [Sinimarinibacterium flocculans]|uniref:Putative ABC transport system ATP-binding protein n=1 Tax=Sinimarinibacterium flocculans TaxID=985250 RepID=A0A318E2Y1_9GAMM|nr:ABC transporter ATP-binding protein [Pseudomonadota bacterium]PXV65247.1 putative ABC transport system ATP-binding protein [Sinimarinibacterium flocculans]